MLDAFSAPKAIAAGGPDPDSAPIKPLGHVGDRYWLLSGIGELRSVTARDLHSANIVYGLFTGGQHRGEHVRGWLSANFPPKRDRKGAAADDWSHLDAGRWIMEACVERGLYDEDMPVRHLGVWRSGAPDDPDSIALAHCGAVLIDAEGRTRRAGARIGAAVYPAIAGGRFPRSPQPAEAAAPVGNQEVLAFYERVAVGWG